MQDLITESVILSEAKMIIGDYHCEYIFVEGESDRKFYSSVWTQTQSVIFRHVSGWENVHRIVKAANTQHLEHVIGIIDKDFHQVMDDKILNTPNLFFTDENDIEMMLFQSTSFDKFLKICASRTKLETIFKPRECILKPAHHIGALRLISKCERLNLDFDEVDFKDFINKSNLKINVDSLIEKVCQRTCSKGKKLPLNKETIKSKLTETMNLYCPLQLCTGHDVLEIICIAMNKFFATASANTYCSDDIFTYLLMGYSQEQFEKSNLYQTYLCWCKQNTNVSIVDKEE